MKWLNRLIVVLGLLLAAPGMASAQSVKLEDLVGTWAGGWKTLNDTIVIRPDGGWHRRQPFRFQAKRYRYHVSGDTLLFGTGGWLITLKDQQLILTNPGDKDDVGVYKRIDVVIPKP